MHCRNRFHFFPFSEPYRCTARNGGVYSSYRNRNFWHEYSTPPTTKYPEYDDYYYLTSEATPTPDPGPQFVDALQNHTVIYSSLGSTTFLNCRVQELRDYQVSIMQIWLYISCHNLSNKLP